MSVKIRLARHGSKKNPIYRVVVADSRVPRDGRTIEEIGRYNPQLQPSLIEIDADRAREWLSRGAQPAKPKRGIGPGNQHHMNLLRQMLDQEIHLRMACCRTDNVEVIDQKCDARGQFRHSGNDLRQYGIQHVVAARGNENRNVARNDAAMRSRAGNSTQIDTGLLAKSSCKRRCEDAAL